MLQDDFLGASYVITVTVWNEKWKFEESDGFDSTAKEKLIQSASSSSLRGQYGQLD